MVQSPDLYLLRSVGSQTLGKVFRLLISLFLLATVLFACGRNKTLKIGDQDILALGPQDECSFMTNAGLRVSWKSSTPVRMVIHPKVPTRFDAVIFSAAEKWNSAFGRVLLEVARGGPDVKGPSGADHMNVIYWDTEWASGESNKQAWTWTAWEISKIADADVRINAKDFEFFVDGDLNGAEKVHLESLLVHEFGHALGLSHQDGKKSVMQVMLQSGEKRVTPAESDIESLRCEY